MSNPIPECLTKRGILRVVDNRKPGQRVAPSVKLFFTLFKDEIMQKCTQPAEFELQPTVTPPTAPCRCDPDDYALEQALATIERISKKRSQP